MFSFLVVIPVISLILVAVVSLFGTLFRKVVNKVTFEYDHTHSDDTKDKTVGPTETANQATEPSRSTSHVSRRSVTNTSNAVVRHAADITYQRPGTPVQINHYRPATPVHQIRPITPSDTVPLQHQRVPASPTDTADGYRQLNSAITRIESETEAGFKTYAELTEDERAEVANLGQCIVDVDKSALEPLLAKITFKGDDRTARYVVGRFDKSDDGLLSQSHKFIRQSFRIVNKKTNTCRLARLRVQDSGEDRYRLTFHDYTPYVDKSTPKFDVYNMEKTKERFGWVTVKSVLLHYNTEPISVSHMLILVPSGKGNHLRE